MLFNTVNVSVLDFYGFLLFPCWQVNYLVTVVTLLIAFALFGKGVYTSADNFPAVMCLLLLYGWVVNTSQKRPFAVNFTFSLTSRSLKKNLSQFLSLSLSLSLSL